MVQYLLRRTRTNKQTTLPMALSPENWVRDGAKAVDANNKIVGCVADVAVRFSILGLIQRNYGYAPYIKGIYYRALLAHKLPVDRPDSEITIEQANQVLSTYLTLRNEK